ncbi:AI-2E family transporter [Naasia sp. SYSU D00948]|uniref:AI-2E family transporter n=1 Tax=Naasia sp. SYSU D00948 TaxID=2817379 RepID=UPI001B3170DE|nr:AI-2E family transporter [Naasia sp. SYSU D00948]
MGIQRNPDPSRLLPMLTDRLGRVALRSGQILLVLILTVAVIWGLLQLKVVVIPVLLAIILGAAFAPVVGWLVRHGVPRTLAAWITLLGTLFLLALLLTLVGYAVQRQWRTLVTSASEGFAELQQLLADLNVPIDAEQLGNFREQLVDYVTSAEFGSRALGGVSVVTEVVAGMFLLIVVLFFFLKDGEKIWRFFLRPLNPVREARGERIGQTGLRVLGGYVRGTAIVALVDAVAIGAALFIMQVPLALPLTVIVFLGAFIPIVGATVAGILAALVALIANGPVVALIVVGVVIAVNQLEGDLLQPLVMGQSLKLHPLVILLALTAGTILGGIIGAILSVPIAAVAWAIVKVWDEPQNVPDTEAIGPESPGA